MTNFPPYHLPPQFLQHNPGSGRPRLRPRRIVGDKGYSSGNHLYLRRRGIRLTIPRKLNERRRGKA